MVEREGFSFLVGIEYEKLPMLCSHCKIIGHSLRNCNKTQKPEEGNNVQKKVVSKYIPKVKEAIRPIEVVDTTDGAAIDILQQNNSKFVLQEIEGSTANLQLTMGQDAENKDHDNVSVDSVYDESIHPNSPNFVNHHESTSLNLVHVLNTVSPSFAAVNSPSEKDLKLTLIKRIR